MHDASTHSRRGERFLLRASKNTIRGSFKKRAVSIQTQLERIINEPLLVAPGEVLVWTRLSITTDLERYLTDEAKAGNDLKPEENKDRRTEQSEN